MKNNKFIIVISLILTMASCNKEVDVVLPNAMNRLIVEGRVDKMLGQSQYEQQIVLSTLNDFFDQSQTPRVTDATVKVTDSEGNEYPYEQDINQAGRYVNTELKGEIGETYTLRIEWKGEIYEASETLIGVSGLENVYQQYESANAFEDGGIKLAIDFNDPQGEENFYFWELYVNGQNVIKADPGNSGNIIAKDVLWDGQKIVGYFPNEEKVFEVDDEVTVRHIGISEATYNFLFLLFEQTGQTGQLVDVPPALIKGNIRNLTNPTNIAMGFFGASEVDEAKIVITE